MTGPIRDKLTAAGLFLVSAYFIFITFPYMNFSAVSTGIDGSWRYAINILASSQFIFGKDFIFARGPLGYLTDTLDIGSNWNTAIAFRIFAHAVFSSCILFYLISAKNISKIAGLLIFFCMYVFSYFIGLLEPNYFLTYLIFISAMLADITSRKVVFSIPASFVNGLFATVLLFVKFGAGIFAMIFGFVYIAAVNIRRPLHAAGLAALNSALASFWIVMLSSALLQSPGNFIPFFTSSMKFSEMFSEAFSVIGPSNELFLVAVSVAVYSLFLACLAAMRSSLSGKALSMGVLLFFAFKQGFVRQDDHVLFFATLVPVLLTGLILFSDDLIAVTASTINCILITFLCAVMILGRTDISGSFIGNILNSGLAQSNISSISNLDTIRSIKQSETRTNFSRLILPAEWKQELDKGVVDIVPSELSYIPANMLRWRPDPVLQLSWAPDSGLDKLTAEYFSGTKAPESIIAEFENLDGRNMLIDTPATWNAIRSNYIIRFEDISKNRLILSRKAAPSAFPLETISSIDAQFLTPIVLPASTADIYMTADIKLSTFGKAARTFFRVPPVYIRFDYTDGNYSCYRIIPGSLSSALLVSTIANNINELSKLFKGTLRTRTEKITFYGPGVKYYVQPFKIEFKKVLQ